MYLILFYLLITYYLCGHSKYEFTIIKWLLLHMNVIYLYNKCYYNSNSHASKILIHIYLFLWNLIFYFKTLSIYHQWLTSSHLSNRKTLPFNVFLVSSKNKIVSHIMCIEPNVCQASVSAAFLILLLALLFSCSIHPQIYSCQPSSWAAYTTLLQRLLVNPRITVSFHS